MTLGRVTRFLRGHAVAGFTLVAYLLVLGNSPAGRAWQLALHLAKDHHGAGHQVEHEHEHTDGHHEASESDVPDPADLPIAANVPHEHNGNLHTHEQAPNEHPLLLSVSLAKYYLFSSPVSSIPPPAQVRALAGRMAAPLQITLSVETPPPRC